MAPSPAPQLIENTCLVIQPCRLPAVNARSNGDLHLALERAEAAWGECAAVVDTIIRCQAEVGSDE
ncbi:MAG: Rz1-like lysis system protein LysC [Duganella sp.]